MMRHSLLAWYVSRNIRSLRPRGNHSSGFKESCFRIPWCKGWPTGLSGWSDRGRRRMRCPIGIMNITSVTVSVVLLPYALSMWTIDSRGKVRRSSHETFQVALFLSMTERRNSIGVRFYDPIKHDCLENERISARILRVGRR